MIFTKDGNLLLLASSASGAYNTSIIKMTIPNNNGSATVLWEKHVNFSSAKAAFRPFAIVPSLDSGCVFTGGYYRPDSSDSRKIMCKLDVNGNPVWNKSVTANNNFYSLVETVDSGYVFAGSYYNKDTTVAQLLKIKKWNTSVEQNIQIQR